MFEHTNAYDDTTLWFQSDDGWGYRIDAEKGFIPCPPEEPLFSGDGLKFDDEQVGVRVLSASQGDATPPVLEMAEVYSDVSFNSSDCVCIGDCSDLMHFLDMPFCSPGETQDTLGELAGKGPIEYSDLSHRWMLHESTPPASDTTEDRPEVAFESFGSSEALCMEDWTTLEHALGLTPAFTGSPLTLLRKRARGDVAENDDPSDCRVSRKRRHLVGEAVVVYPALCEVENDIFRLSQGKRPSYDGGPDPMLLKRRLLKSYDGRKQRGLGHRKRDKLKAVLQDVSNQMRPRARIVRGLFWR